MVSRAKREPESTTSYEASTSQPRVEPFFFFFQFFSFLGTEKQLTGKREKDSVPFLLLSPPPPPPSQKPLKKHQILWKTCVENDVRRKPQRGSFVWLEKVGSIIGGFSSDNGNGSKNARFFRVCRAYVNLVKMSADVLLIKPITF